MMPRDEKDYLQTSLSAYDDEDEDITDPIATSADADNADMNNADEDHAESADVSVPDAGEHEAMIEYRRLKLTKPEPIESEELNVSSEEEQGTDEHEDASVMTEATRHKALIALVIVGIAMIALTIGLVVKSHVVTGYVTAKTWSLTDQRYQSFLFIESGAGDVDYDMLKTKYGYTQDNTLGWTMTYYVRVSQSMETNQYGYYTDAYTSVAVPLEDWLTYNIGDNVRVWD